MLTTDLVATGVSASSLGGFWLISCTLNLCTVMDSPECCPQSYSPVNKCCYQGTTWNAATKRCDPCTLGTAYCCLSTQAWVTASPSTQGWVTAKCCTKGSALVHGNCCATPSADHTVCCDGSNSNTINGCCAGSTPLWVQSKCCPAGTVALVNGHC
jgi:hypothetical protein